MTTQSHLYKQDDEMKLPSCCAYHGFEEGGCNGRNCPEGRYELPSILTRRLSPEDITRQRQESEYLWTRELGVEAADAPRVTGAVPPIVTDEIEPVREPISGQAKVLIVAVCLFWLAILALSIADPRDLSTLWPRLVALASF